MPAISSAPSSTRAQRRHPFVSACMIVKDEEKNVPACLSSLAGIADELVVYDTGSTDRTAEVARAAGARVVQGEWHDDFGRARNASLASCRGDWIIWLDADETLQCDDLAALRDLLVRTRPDIDAWSVAIDNLTGAGVGAGFVHHAARIFRRKRCEWTGRIHEQVAIRGTHRGIRQETLTIARIRHTGYLDAVMTARHKSERNLRVAAREVEDADGWEKGFSLVSLGRSFVTAGRFAEGLTHCSEALDHTDNAVTRRLATRTAAEACIGLGRFDDAATWIERLRAASGTPVQADAVEVRLALARGDWERAMTLLDALGDQARDEDGFEYVRPVLAQQRAEALVGLGRRGEAADILLAVLGDAGVLDRHLGEIIETLKIAGRPLTELAERIPAEHEPMFMAQVLQLQVDVADATLEACFTCRPSSTAVLATASTLARRLPIERALVWSARLRAEGYRAACPLRFIADDVTTPPALRARSAATAVAAFRDDVAVWQFAKLMGTAGEADRAQMQTEADVLCPALSYLTDPGLGGHGSDSRTAPEHRQDRRHTKPVQWVGPFLNHSGYGEEARGFLAGLTAQGIAVAARSSGDESTSFIAGLRDTPELARTVQRSMATPTGPAGTTVLHVPGYAVAPVPGARNTVVRTMFETDDLPPDWVSRINTVDEVWVPSTFNAGTFRDAGVRVPIHVVPGGVDTDHFRPGLPPLPIPGVQGTVFLAVFEWSHRKAPDLLLRAWSEAFRPDSAVTLVLRCFPRSQFDGDSTKEVEALVDAELTAFGATRKDVAPIVVLGDQLSPGMMPRLMNAANVFIGVSRGEGSGRPQLEAMSCGLPVIATRWSGNLDFMDNDNSLLIDVDELVPVDEHMDVPFYRGHRWAQPSVSHLTDLMRRSVQDPALVERVGRRARRDVEARWRWAEVSAQAAARLAALAARAHTAGSRTAGCPQVRWVGDVYADHSLATVSRELVTRLAIDSRLRIDVRTDERAPHPADSAALLRNVRGAGRPATTTVPTIEVRHHWPPDLSISNADACILVQPWEHGGIPRQWIQPIHDHIDEVWVPTSWVKDCYTKSGIPADKVAVVPNGVDTVEFRPDGPSLPLATDKGTRLLFVGGTIDRKGFDVLLETYLQTFGPEDDVCLVVKPFGGDSVYRASAMDAMVRAAAQDHSSAAVELVDRRLSRAEMAQLYRSCDILVHPYRGEGFGLPIAEAMACGLPTIVTGYGACLDFCDATTSWLLQARETPLSVQEFEPGPAGFWWAEPDRAHLQHLLRLVLHAKDERRHKGDAARQRIVASFTWDHATSTAINQLLSLAQRIAPSRHHSSAPRTGSPRQATPGDAHRRTQPDRPRQTSPSTAPLGPDDRSRLLREALQNVTTLLTPGTSRRPT